MSDMQFVIVMLAAGSLYCNHLLYKRLKAVELAKQNNYKVYLTKCEIIKNYENLEEDKNKEIKELEEKCKFFKGISERKIRRVDKLTEKLDDLGWKYSDLEWAYEILTKAYNQNTEVA